MKPETIVIIAGIVAYILMRKQLLKERSNEYVKSIKATLIIPILQIIFFVIFFYSAGSEAIETANNIDSLHNISTYTPFLGDYGSIAEMAYQNGLISDIERSEITLEFISAARMASNAVNIGILIVIVLALAELYGVFRVGRFSKKQMWMFYEGVSTVTIICGILLGVYMVKFTDILSTVMAGTNSLVTFFIMPIQAILVVGIPFIFYKKALNRLFLHHKEKSDLVENERTQSEIN